MPRFDETKNKFFKISKLTVTKMPLLILDSNIIWPLGNLIKSLTWGSINYLAMLLLLKLELAIIG